jgi:hypothetical protein
VPAASPVLFCVVRPLLQAKVYGEVAPLGVKFIDPLFKPQRVFIKVEETDTADEAVTRKEVVAVQPLALVTVTLIDPAARPVLFCVVRPLLQAKVYGEVAPLGVILIKPLFIPQLAFVTAEEIVTAVEPETVIDDVAVQLFALVTVTV